MTIIYDEHHGVIYRKAFQRFEIDICDHAFNLALRVNDAHQNTHNMAQTIGTKAFAHAILDARVQLSTPIRNMMQVHYLR